MLVQPENKKDAKIITIRQLVLRQYKMTKQKKANEKKSRVQPKTCLISIGRYHISNSRIQSSGFINRKRIGVFGEYRSVSVPNHVHSDSHRCLVLGIAIIFSFNDQLKFKVKT